MRKTEAEGLRRSPEDPPPKCEKHTDTYLHVEDCGSCGGDGETEPGELYDQDPLWYDQDDVEMCHACSGRGWFRECWKCIEGIAPTGAPGSSSSSDPEAKR